MAINIINNTKYKEDKDMPDRYRDGEQKDREDECLQESLDRPKSICRPWRRVHRPVMLQMDQTEYFRMMDDPVHPIEISIMHHKQDRKDQKEIHPPPCRNRSI